MELICINDVFIAELKALIPVRPINQKLYRVRDLFQLKTGPKKNFWAVHLVEIQNPKIESAIPGMMYEPSFNLDRFTTLSGHPPSAEEIENFINNLKTIKDER